MSRTSNNHYRIIDGVKTLWNGYDYDRQYWVFEGEKDTRTLEELQVSIQNSINSLRGSALKIGATV